MSSNRVNFEAYANIERLEHYTPESMAAYRAGRMARYRPHVEFVRARSTGPIDAIEVGSGSSAFLYAMAAAGVLREGLGIELSPTRHEFAERWKADAAFTGVVNRRANFTDVDFGSARWDWTIVIDNTFTYLYPEDPAYPDRLLESARAGLRPGGRILLDFINYANRVPGTDYRQWTEFPPTDPFAYGLYSNRVTDGVNDSLSIFVRRAGGEDRKAERSRVYPLADLTALLARHGFRVEESFADFAGGRYDEATSERLLVVGRATR